MRKNYVAIKEKVGIYFARTFNQIYLLLIIESLYLAGCFKHFMFFSTWGDDPIWRAYFSAGFETTN